MSLQRYDDKERELRRTRPVDLEFLCCNEAPHYYGHNFDTGEVNGAGELDFHCEIKLYQEDSETNVTFRHVAARLKHGEIISYEAKGIPENMKIQLCKRIMIIYQVIYPKGLTLEMMSL